MLNRACHFKTYFTFYLIHKHLKLSTSDLRKDIDHCACDMPMFLINYVLKNGVDIIFSCYSPSKLACSHYTCSSLCVILWLQLCYDRNMAAFSLDNPMLSEFIRNSRDKPEWATVYCNTLIELGFDIDCNGYGKYGYELHPPIFSAIQVDNIALVRTLIYHGCNLDKLVHEQTPKSVAEFALDLSLLDILKVLLVCGAKVTP